MVALTTPVATDVASPTVETLNAVQMESKTLKSPLKIQAKVVMKQKMEEATKIAEDSADVSQDSRESAEAQSAQSVSSPVEDSKDAKQKFNPIKQGHTEQDEKSGTALGSRSISDPNPRASDGVEIDEDKTPVKECSTAGVTSNCLEKESSECDSSGGKRPLCGSESELQEEAQRKKQKCT
eukprot:TRINITY_DN52653_c0_g1_i1.p1 TRINITY_DN52653_c0_g1~~TRINITY_DN52653_c0_g1_i1.p1  ORF type:complete len:181 (-),score=36.72 TRINITY_DN52653_c0_g1_i1:96-638(-)